MNSHKLSKLIQKIPNYIYNFSTNKQSQTIPVIGLISDETIKKELLNIYTQYLKQRCSIMGFVPLDLDSNMLKYKQNNTKNDQKTVKLFGDFTQYLDTAYWADLDLDTYVHKNLYLSEDEIELINMKIQSQFQVPDSFIKLQNQQNQDKDFQIQSQYNDLLQFKQYFQQQQNIQKQQQEEQKSKQNNQQPLQN